MEHHCHLCLVKNIIQERSAANLHIADANAKRSMPFPLLFYLKSELFYMFTVVAFVFLMFAVGVAQHHSEPPPEGDSCPDSLQKFLLILHHLFAFIHFKVCTSSIDKIVITVESNIQFYEG